MKRHKIFGVLVVLGLIGLVVAAIVIAANVTLTTFYPAPFGEYLQMIVTGDSAGDMPPPDGTIDLTIGQDNGAGAITREATVQINGNVAIGQPGDDPGTQDRNLTVSGDVAVGDANTPTTSSVTLNGSMTVDDNDDVAADVTLGVPGGAPGDNAILNVNGQIQVNGVPIAGGFPAPDYDSFTAPIGTISGAGFGGRLADGWVVIDQGRQVSFEHNLGTNIVVYLLGGKLNGGMMSHQFKYGTDNDAANVVGAEWSNNSTGRWVTVIRAADDLYWTHVRLLIWVLP